MSQGKEERGHAFAVPHLLSIRTAIDKRLQYNFADILFFVITNGNDDDEWMNVSGNNWVAGGEWTCVS
jgi:hypothetical protein